MLWQDVAITLVFEPPGFPLTLSERVHRLANVRLEMLSAHCPCAVLAAILFLIVNAHHSRATGVTVITHGYNSDANGWVSAMADEIPSYVSFPGTNFTTYKLILTTDGNGNYFFQSERTNGVSPVASDSGEILVKLDWSQMAGGTAPYDISTYDVAWIASWVLMQTNAIAELGGHALAEFPIHLVGHSRGGSLVSEMSRLLGTNGIWIDHITTLDPHPLNNDGNFDLFFPTDASAAQTYANVLYHDNYWQDFPGGFLDFNGEAVAGAYNRHLTDLSGGYNNTAIAAPYHSNVHLWYHGTIDWFVPTSDGDASITSAERQTWWAASEMSGTNAGFEYSLIGGGNRLSAAQPLGPGFSAIMDGYNLVTNRVALTSNSGAWPNLISFDRVNTNDVVPGQTLPARLLYQWIQPTTSVATVTFYLDDDFNPLNGNERSLGQSVVPGSSATIVGNLTIPVGTDTAQGVYALFAKITGGGRSRYVYAPHAVRVVSPSSLRLDISSLPSGSLQIAVNAAVEQTVAIDASFDLMTWHGLATNIVGGAGWNYRLVQLPPGSQFYRARKL